MSDLLKKVRLDVLVCVTALTAMAVSAVSACACVHHAERVARASCHSASSEPAAHGGHKTHGVHGTHSQNHQHAVAMEHDGNSFDAPCNCGEADSVTAATVRGEAMRHPAAMIAETADIPEFEYEHAVTPASAQPPTGYISSYASLFRKRSGPARAPPRL